MRGALLLCIAIVCFDVVVKAASSSSSSSSSLVSGIDEVSTSNLAFEQIDENAVGKLGIGITGCDETIRGTHERDYVGCQTHTVHGLTCQRWDQQSPHQHGQWGRHGTGHHNYCRNPSNWHGGLWCYTTNSNVRWQACDRLPEAPSPPPPLPPSPPPPGGWPIKPPNVEIHNPQKIVSELEFDFGIEVSDPDGCKNSRDCFSTSAYWDSVAAGLTCEVYVGDSECIASKESPSRPTKVTSTQISCMRWDNFYDANKIGSSKKYLGITDKNGKLAVGDYTIIYNCWWKDASRNVVPTSSTG